MPLEHGKGLALARMLNPLEKCPAATAQERSGLDRTSGKANRGLDGCENTAIHGHYPRVIVAWPGAALQGAHAHGLTSSIQARPTASSAENGTSAVAVGLCH